MASVSIRTVKKNFGEVPILHGVDIEIKDGSFTVLVGPSGCGKSTLLRMIAGLEEISSGEIHIGNRQVNDLPPKERDIAMVFQNYALYPHMTVGQNMAFSLTLAKRPQEEIDKKVARAADILALGSLLERYPRQLSNLDAKLRVAMRSEIKELHQRLQTTSIYVTHDQIEAMTMGDQIVVMRDGRIEQTGSPLELYDFPSNQFVAGFIGSPAMNFLPGKLLVNAGQCQVELNDGLKLDLPRPVQGQNGQPVVFGTRPEHLSLVNGAGISAHVAVMEPTGMDTFVACRHEGVEFSAVFRERHDFKLGSTIHLQPDMARSHVFDASTGMRLIA
ncbi:MAG: sn-glycerol-3-phosphate import ATP-binding protein UgpC [Pseudomonadota bacterium]